MKIAIAITTHNRYETFKKCYDWMKVMLPSNAHLFVVDDGSEIPVPEATFRFEKTVGIAATKNKCLELCEGADHIFCFDDDIHPTCSDWYLPYIHSGLNHACFTFGRNIIKRHSTYFEFERPCGCMLYFKKICLDQVGGFDTSFILYSYEHVNLSDRIFNAGLTPARYVDVIDSMSRFYSYDREQGIQSSVSEDLRRAGIRNNTPLLEQKKLSKDFIPYK